jgi:hypothetical protein
MAFLFVAQDLPSYRAVWNGGDLIFPFDAIDEH